jgi:hypothetical protein
MYFNTKQKLIQEALTQVLDLCQKFLRYINNFNVGHIEDNGKLIKPAKRLSHTRAGQKSNSCCPWSISQSSETVGRAHHPFVKPENKGTEPVF